MNLLRVVYEGRRPRRTYLTLLVPHLIREVFVLCKVGCRLHPLMVIRTQYAVQIRHMFPSLPCVLFVPLLQEELLVRASASFNPCGDPLHSLIQVSPLHGTELMVSHCVGLRVPNAGVKERKLYH